MKFWIWIMYLIPIPELTLWIGKLLGTGYYDCIFAQSFSWKKFFNRGKLISKDAELMEIVHRVRRQNPLVHDGQLFKILEREGFEPGRSNETIAEVCIEMCDGQHPIIAQWEVAFEIYRLVPGLYNVGLLRVIWPKNGESYITTEQVKTRSVEMMQHLELTAPLEIAHHGMWARAMLIIYKLGVAPVPLVVRIPWTGAESGQPKTSNWSSWVPYEILVRIHHVIKRIVW